MRTNRVWKIMARSHLANTRSGVWDKERPGNMKETMGEKTTGAADLCAGHFVVRRSQPHCGLLPEWHQLPPHAWASQALRFCFPEKRRAASRQAMWPAQISGRAICGYV